MTVSTERPLPPQRPGRTEVIAEFDPGVLKAPFALRLGALFIDYIILISIPVLTLLLGVYFGGARNGQAGATSNSTGWLLGALLCLTNFLILPAVNGQTIGKMLAGIRIVKINGTGVSFGTILLRHFLGYLLTAATLGLGFVLAALGRNGRALHDLVARTVVVYARRRIR
jgi:uncharacterized RDD family membrane protein YckC